MERKLVPEVIFRHLCVSGDLLVSPVPDLSGEAQRVLSVLPES